MTTARAPRALLLAVLVVAGVGILDAAIGRTWDLVALLSVVAVLAAGGLVSTLGPRRPVLLRADRAAELTARARATGEAPDAVLDRAVATYLDGLADPAPPPTATEAPTGGS